MIWVARSRGQPLRAHPLRAGSQPWASCAKTSVSPPHPNPDRREALASVRRRLPAAGVDGLLERRAGRELRGLGCLDLDRLTGRGVTSGPRRALSHRKLPKPGDRNLITPLQRLLNGVEQRVDRASPVGPGTSLPPGRPRRSALTCSSALLINGGGSGLREPTRRPGQAGRPG